MNRRKEKPSHVYAPEDIAGLSQLAGDYDTVMCDLWGTLHDGVELFPAAVVALQRYRSLGCGTVILLSNSARPNAYIQSHLEGMGLSPDCWDAIVTSGDVAVEFLGERIHIPLFHIGPDRDHVLYDEVERLASVRPLLSDAASAELVVCTGTGGREPAFFDKLLRYLASRHLPMLCANPDLTAPNGSSPVYCAGTLADRYRGMGGQVHYTGKPHGRIYEKALSVASSFRGQPKRVLAIGDGLETDIRGAVQQGWDAMYVQCGVGGNTPRPHVGATGGLAW